MGTRCVYNWTDMVVDMGLDNIVHNDREPRHARIFTTWIKDWESDILRTRNQDNYQRLLQKYNNIRFLDDEENQAYTIAPIKGLPNHTILLIPSGGPFKLQIFWGNSISLIFLVIKEPYIIVFLKKALIIILISCSQDI